MQLGDTLNDDLKQTYKAALQTYGHESVEIRNELVVVDVPEKEIEDAMKRRRQYSDQGISLLTEDSELNVLPQTYSNLVNPNSKKQNVDYDI